MWLGLGPEAAIGLLLRPGRQLGDLQGEGGLVMAGGNLLKGVHQAQ